MLGLVELLVLLDKMTYASYIDTPQAFLVYLIPCLLLGILIDFITKSITLRARILAFIASFSAYGSSYLGPVYAPVGPDGGLTALWFIIAAVTAAVLWFALERDGRRGQVAGLLTFLALVLPSILGFVVPPYPSQNTLYNSLQANITTGEPDHYIQNTSEIRVIPWTVATAYLHRAYGDAAAYLDTSSNSLHRYTDPTYVNGRFVWVNLPLFEQYKWFGDRDHPGYAYVENIPENMSLQEPNIVHTVNATIDWHVERIEWSKRIAQKLFDRYSDYVIVQTRFDVDDALRPYIIVYLGKTDAMYARTNLEKLLIIDVATGAEQAFDVGDASIPAWLEVVYPDWYVYDWTAFWAHNRFGWGYTWTNKQHLYEPDDSSARFIVVNGVTYWQIPLRQQDSNVLGGYVTVETRTGKAVFYDRETRSMADLATALIQVSRYLTSGEFGFQTLDIHEGYLYPFKQASGQTREAYVFPLYAGFSILKYAILDAQEYTSPPVVAESLPIAVEQYEAQAYGVGANKTEEALVWKEYAIGGAYVGKDPNSAQEEAVVTLNGSTYVVTAQELRGGLIDASSDEWRELNLAITDFQRTGNVSIWVTIRSGGIRDVDYDASDLVHR